LIYLFWSSGSSPAQAEFLKEAEQMVGLEHPNIVKIVGVAVQQRPWLTVLEFVDVSAHCALFVLRRLTMALLMRTYHQPGHSLFCARAALQYGDLLEVAKTCREKQFTLTQKEFYNWFVQVGLHPFLRGITTLLSPSSCNTPTSASICLPPRC